MISQDDVGENEVKARLLQAFDGRLIAVGGHDRVTLFGEKGAEGDPDALFVVDDQDMGAFHSVTM